MCEKLTDAEIKKFEANAKKDQRLADGKGLYLVAKPTGLYWRIDYRYNREQNTYSIGTYPEVSLAQARAELAKVKAWLVDGKDPNKEKKAEGPDSTFKQVADKWLNTYYASADKADNTIKNMISILNGINKAIGNTPINKIDMANFTDYINQLENSGAVSLAHRRAKVIFDIVQYASLRKIINSNPLAGYEKLFVSHKKPQVNHYKAVTGLAVAELFQSIGNADRFEHKECYIALQILTRVFCRPGELINAKWAEVDLNAKVWTIPAGRMKCRADHKIPLAEQVISLFTQLKELTGDQEYCFCLQGRKTPFSPVTLRKALTDATGHKEQTLHGFRSVASTTLNENGYRPDLIEKQLAHCDPNNIRRIYNKAEYWPERVEMMQAYSNMIDRLSQPAGGTE